MGCNKDSLISEGKKEKKQVNAKSVSHHLPPVDRCPASPQAAAMLERPNPRILLLSTTLYGREYPFGQLSQSRPLQTSFPAPAYSLRVQSEKQKRP